MELRSVLLLRNLFIYIPVDWSRVWDTYYFHSNSDNQEIIKKTINWLQFHIHAKLQSGTHNESLSKLFSEVATI